MDHAKTLIRSATRAFHDVRHVIIVDALMVHSALSVDDLHHLTGIQQKDIRKLLGKLKEDRLVSVQSRQEVKVGNNKPLRDSYYINFHATIDAIKYRVFFLTKKIKDSYKPTEEKKDYFCPRCKSRWTQLEVLDKFFEGGFLCHRCDGVLQRDETSAADSIGHQTQSKLMSQIEPFLELLKRIDQEEIPQNDFATALSNAVPVARDSETHPVVLDAATDAKQDTKFMPKLKQEVNMEVKVNFISEESTRAAEEHARARKAAQEKQNALPSWHTQSTVDVPKVEDSPTSPTIPVPRINGVEPEEEDKKNLNIKQNSEMEAYLASLKAELARGAEAEEEDDDDEDGDDGFEDVDIGSAIPSGVGTPRSEISSSAPMSSLSAMNGKGKRKADRESEAGFLNVSTSDSLDNSPVKKIKLEESAVASAVSTPDDRDSDEDEEFEDAL
ncbi:MAG: hypothetical protein GOMPHAMPRED_006247 [Gomphillus americanus]|uniref:HTH TFE/IIEalpha-type domain-containing protein n=1 Tax=Gomphillus americanus TaxID=1940652 RepID=A0A8H3EN75_9LECA|nr:MAG: hypothetical protein GOMPHAMPRED_006247 [Gomphillus americanus]